MWSIEPGFDPKLQIVLTYCRSSYGSGVSDTTQKDTARSLGMRMGLHEGTANALAWVLTKERTEYLTQDGTLYGGMLAAVLSHEAFKLLEQAKEIWTNYMAEHTGQKGLSTEERNARSQEVYTQIAALFEPVIMPDSLKEWYTAERHKKLLDGTIQSSRWTPEDRDWLVAQADAKLEEARVLQERLTES